MASPFQFDSKQTSFDKSSPPTANNGPSPAASPSPPFSNTGTGKKVSFGHNTNVFTFTPNLQSKGMNNATTSVTMESTKPTDPVNTSSTDRTTGINKKLKNRKQTPFKVQVPNGNGGGPGYNPSQSHFIGTRSCKDRKATPFRPSFPQCVSTTTQPTTTNDIPFDTAPLFSKPTMETSKVARKEDSNGKEETTSSATATTVGNKENHNIRNDAWVADAIEQGAKIPPPTKKAPPVAFVPKFSSDTTASTTENPTMFASKPSCRQKVEAETVTSPEDDKKVPPTFTNPNSPYLFPQQRGGANDDLEKKLPATPPTFANKMPSQGPTPKFGSTNKASLSSVPETTEDDDEATGAPEPIESPPRKESEDHVSSKVPAKTTPVIGALKKQAPSVENVKANAAQNGLSRPESNSNTSVQQSDEFSSYRNLSVDQILGSFQKEFEDDQLVYSQEGRRVFEYDHNLRTAEIELFKMIPMTHILMLTGEEFHASLASIEELQKTLCKELDELENQTDQLFRTTQAMTPTDADYYRDRTFQATNAIEQSLEDVRVQVDAIDTCCNNGTDGSDMGNINKILSDNEKALIGIELAGIKMDADISQIQSCLGK